jgi:ADP-ribose pyrophosphatase YjhB (NUDIX family)
VDPGESYENAAIRELREELRISCELKEVMRLGASEVTDNEHVVLYRAVTDCEPNPDPDEIQWGAFFKPEDLTARMAEAPEDFVPVFIHLWQAYVRAGN